MTAQSISILIATNMMHNNNQCQQSNFCLTMVFLLSLIVLLDKQRSGYDQWRYHAPTNHRKAIIQHHSFYQSFDGPAPIPSIANMPLDDITIRIDFEHTWVEVPSPIRNWHAHWRIKILQEQCLLTMHPIKCKSTMLKNPQTNLS